jgi:ABC-type polysaccharide/polyol phosphate transport system ATPase subunit
MTLVAELRHVTKTYRLGSERSNWRALVPGPLGETTGGDHFNALDDVSLQVHRGQAVGIVGENGAGKSTLLKVLAGIVRPTSGSVEVSGRIAAAIELGVGFDPDLTGYENLRFAGALFGVPAAEVDRRQDQIVEFSGLGEFMGMPVKRYSTGMRARLGFSLVTAFDADVVILDEVLSVGDWAFQQQCVERVRELHAAGAAVIAVSHSNWLITQICDHAVLLENGTVVLAGDPLTVIERYLGEDTITDTTKDERFPTLPMLATAPGDGHVRFRDLVVEPAGINPNDPLELSVVVEVDEPVDADLVMSIYTMGRAVFADPDIGPSEILRRPGTWKVSVRTDRLPFSPGSFKVRVAALHGLDPDDHTQEHLGALATISAPFKVLGPPSTRPGLQFDTEWSVGELTGGTAASEIDAPPSAG